MNAPPKIFMLLSVVAILFSSYSLYHIMHRESKAVGNAPADPDVLDLPPAVGWKLHEDTTLIDRFISVPVEQTRVLGIDFMISDVNVDKVVDTVNSTLLQIRGDVDQIAATHHVSEIAYWGYNGSLNKSGSDPTFKFSGFTSFLMTTNGNDPQFVQALKEKGYTAKITPYIMGRCGDQPLDE